MDLGGIKRRAKNGFGDNTGAQLTDEMIVDWANDACVDIARKTECLSVVLTEAIDIGDPIELPPNFVREFRVAVGSGVSSKVLKKTSIEALNKNHDDLTSVGISDFYYITGSFLQFYPGISVNATATSVYAYVTPTAPLEDNADVPEIPEIYHEDIVRYVIARAKEMDEEDTKAAALMGEYEGRIAQSKFDESETADTYPSIRVLPGDYGNYY